MTREDKILMAIDKGYTCNPETGEIFGVGGGVITNKHSKGYINISIRDGEKIYSLKGHQFIYYSVYKKCVEQIDHINGIRLDNRIINLRSVTNQQNQWNQTKAKGYSWHKRVKKWHTQIQLNGNKIHLGYFDTELEASQAYLDAKKIYHNIN